MSRRRATERGGGSLGVPIPPRPGWQRAWVREKTWCQYSESHIEQPVQGQVAAWAAAHRGRSCGLHPASPTLDSRPWAGLHACELCLWGPVSFFSETNCAPLAHRTVMTKEGDRGRGPSGGPSVPLPGLGPTENRGEQKWEEALQSVCPTGNYKEPPPTADPTQAF